MNLLEKLEKVDTIFLDTAPIIYYIEAHPQYGHLMRDIVNSFQKGEVTAYSSVITLAEVLPKPIKNECYDLAEQFIKFLKYGINFYMIDITADISEKAGKLRGYYPSLKAFDALQLAAAIVKGTQLFITNDKKLIKCQEMINILVLADYL